MGKFIILAMAAAAWLAPSAARGAAPARPTEPGIIFDTDLGNDVDDVMALALLHALQNRGECRILAVTLTNPDPLAGKFVAALDTFYGRGGIPIGVSPGAPRVSAQRYLKLAESFPCRFDPGSAPSSLKVLRQALAGAEDGSVVMVQVGFAYNLARLLDSPGDEVSPLAGRELVKRKVRLLSLMGGAFQPVRGNARYREFNIRFDIPDAAHVAKDWPTPRVWSGWEVGNVIPYAAASIDHDFAYVAHHPVREAYQLYRRTPHERPTWDLTSALYAVLPDRGYFTVSPPGGVTVEPDGFTHYVAAPAGPDRYLAVDARQAAAVRALFSALVSEPPQP